MANDCFENGFPIIHLQNTPFKTYDKPEKHRFDIYLKGKLLDKSFPKNKKN